MTDNNRLHDLERHGQATRRHALVTLAVGLGLAAAPGALAANLATRPPAERADLGRVTDLLNSIRSLQADFTQMTEDGGMAAGTFFLERPGRLRFEYAPPSPVLIVGTGRTLVFFDAQLDQVTYLPIGQSPLAFLLDDRFTFERDDIRLEGMERRSGLLAVTVASEKNPNDGSVTIVFSDQPLQLRQWRVRDPQGKVTTVALSNLRINTPLDRKLFQFDDPNPFRDGTGLPGRRRGG
ncbi:MAG: outer membrane lipoprotein carrier protein LolA [Alphaproteobacteria bacterium]|nr:outer membrane lipoprotein carrier protein LolA [Alphaproteobacteria bacterium]